MNRQIQYDCPNCGFTNKRWIDIEGDNRRLVSCDEEEGGCGMPVVLELHIAVLAQAFGLVCGDSGMAYQEYYDMLRGSNDRKSDKMKSRDNDERREASAPMLAGGLDR